MAKDIALVVGPQTVQVRAGALVWLQWNGKHNGREGVCNGIGWIKPGEKPGSILLIHQTFQSGAALGEYSVKWTIYKKQITGIKLLQGRDTVERRLRSAANN